MNILCLFSGSYSNDSSPGICSVFVSVKIAGTKI